jgi:tryptophanyl-tRNA synthetase
MAHAFKDKASTAINSGLFSYPMLMAADILLYDAQLVTVGKDQLQHLEMTRDVANRFNHKMGDTFVLPQAKVQQHTMYVPGTDGSKMSKSKGNVIDVFSLEEVLKKQIMSIKTDSKAIKMPKNPDNDNVFMLYKLVASKEAIFDMRRNYLSGDYGYVQAKNALYECIIDRFSTERKRFVYFIKNKTLIDKILKYGAKKARKVAVKKMNIVRSTMGLRIR